MKIITFFLLFLASIFVFGQNDSLNLDYIKYSKDFKFSEGIYLNLNQVQQNSPIPLNRIITSEDINSFDFFENLFLNETISFYDENGVLNELETDQFWGYCNDGMLYIYWNDDFNYIPIIGSICHFTATQAITNFPSYSQSSYYYDPYAIPTTSYELKQYILDFESGEIFLYNYTNLLIILMKDPELYDEYNNLRRRKKKQLIFVYLRKYNERNPLMIPVY